MRLSQSLFREIHPDFLRLLAVKSTPLLLDVAAAVEDALRVQPQGIERDEVVAIAEEVIETAPSTIALDDEEIVVPATTRERARLIIDRLCAARWLERIEQSNFQVLLVMSSAASLMIKTLRDIAAVEESVFSDKLSGVCATLANPETMQSEPWGAIVRSLGQAEEGLAELRGMGKSIERHTRRQLEAATLKENLQELFDNFAGGSSGRCYSELVWSHLHTRLGPARRMLEALHVDDTALEKMRAELTRRDPSLSPELAMSRVREKLDHLATLLSTVIPLTERIDQRAAEFVRRSYSRFRYLQESGTDRRGRVKAFFECLNKLGAGLRATELEDRLPVPVPPFRLAEVRLLNGLNSLARGRRTLQAAEIAPLGPEAGEETSKECLDDFAKQLRTALTVVRANRFVSKLPGGKGTRHNVHELVLADDDEVADLIACLLHDNSRQARYRVEIGRILADADKPVLHSIHTNVTIEEITIVKG